jgi:hypothetical protein
MTRGDLVVRQNVAKDGGCFGIVPLRRFSRGVATSDAALTLLSDCLEQRLVTSQAFPISIAQSVFRLNLTLRSESFCVAGTVDNECLANLGVEGYCDATESDGTNLDGPRSSDAGWRQRLAMLPRGQ